MPSASCRAEQQAAPADLDDAVEIEQRRGQARCPAVRRAPARRSGASRAITATTADGRDRRAASRCCRGRRARRRRRRRPRAQQAPTGMPLPIALASVTTSGLTPACSKPNHRPVRPNPVWISSIIISAPTSSQSSRMPAEVLGARRVDAALALHRLDQHRRDRSVDRGARCASRSPQATCRKPSGIGWNGSCFVGWPVAASVASVRPWKLPSALTTVWRPRPPCLRASLMAHSFASAPELVKKICPSWPVASSSSSLTAIAACGGDRVGEEVGHVQQRCGLVGDRLGDHRVGVTERHHGDPGEEVEVALAVRVPQLGAAPRSNMIAGAPNTGMNGHAASGRGVEVVCHQAAPHRRHRRPGPIGRCRVVGTADHRADAGVGEDLEQQDVCDPPVEDVGAAHSVAHRLDAARDLRDHAAGDRAVGDQRVELVGGGLADQRRRVVDVAAQTFDVGEVDELLGAERLGDRAGHGVGVDVVRLPGDVGADGGDRRG